MDFIILVVYVLSCLIHFLLWSAIYFTTLPESRTRKLAAYLMIDSLVGSFFQFMASLSGSGIMEVIVLLARVGIITFLMNFDDFDDWKKKFTNLIESYQKPTLSILPS